MIFKYIYLRFLAFPSYHQSVHKQIHFSYVPVLFHVGHKDVGLISWQIVVIENRIYWISYQYQLESSEIMENGLYLQYDVLWRHVQRTNYRTFRIEVWYFQLTNQISDRLDEVWYFQLVLKYKERLLFSSL